MSSTSQPINVPVSASIARLNFDVVVRGPGGEPLANEWVEVTLQGPGSLAVNFDAKESRRETDADGVARLTWYRRGVYTRDINGMLTVSSAREDASVTMESVPDEAVAAENGPWISWAPRRIKF